MKLSQFIGKCATVTLNVFLWFTALHVFLEIFGVTKVDWMILWAFLFGSLSHTMECKLLKYYYGEV